MKNFELEQMGIIELDAMEMEAIDGGIIGIDDVLLALGVGAVLFMMSDWANVKQGFSDGINGR